MNQQAYWVTEITVEDPESRLPVEMSVFKHQGGGMFAIDSSYYEQVLGDSEEPNDNVIMQDPLNKEGFVELIELPDEIKP